MKQCGSRTFYTDDFETKLSSGNYRSREFIVRVILSMCKKVQITVRITKGRLDSRRYSRKYIPKGTMTRYKHEALVDLCNFIVVVDDERSPSVSIYHAVYSRSLWEPDIR